MIDSVFLFTILFVFLGVLIGTYMKSRSVDKCLRHFRQFHVTLEETDGDIIWGRLKVYSTGLKFIFDEPVKHGNHPPAASYILYDTQYSTIFAMFRFHDELSPENRKIRRRGIDRTYSTAMIHRLLRRMRGVINTFRDAIVKSVGLIIGQMQKVNPGSVILKSQQQQLTTISSDVVGYVGNAYDPILEELIGTPVVLDVFRNGKKQSLQGMMREYTEKFIEICDIRDRVVYTIPLAEKPLKQVSRHLRIVQDSKNNFILKNSGDIAFRLEKLTGKGINAAGEEELVDQPIDLEVAGNGEVPFVTPDLVYQDIRLTLSVARDFDVIVPRTHAVIRHESLPREEKPA